MKLHTVYMRRSLRKDAFVNEAENICAKLDGELLYALEDPLIISLDTLSENIIEVLKGEWH